MTTPSTTQHTMIMIFFCSTGDQEQQRQEEEEEEGDAGPAAWTRPRGQAETGGQARDRQVDKRDTRTGGEGDREPRRWTDRRTGEGGGQTGGQGGKVVGTGRSEG
ncbi:unnamed protein product [Lampetra planeri]